MVVGLGLLAACGFELAPAGTSDDARPPDTAPCVGPDGDGDGKVDVCDPCPLDSPDDPDSDGICSALDLCLAGNDTEDTDLDGVPNACDGWPCGAAPPALAATVTWMSANENVTLSNIDVAGMGQQIVTDPNQPLAVTATFSIVDCQCTNCVDQIEIGLVPGGKHACLYSGNPQGSSAPGCSTPTTGTETRPVTAPATPGVYALRFNRGNDNFCQATGAWWAGAAPGEGNTFARLCVR